MTDTRAWWLVPLAVSLAKSQTRRIPVLVELFTSEGCSSCPAADLMLSYLQQTQPIPGVQIIALGEHVDYWNQLGWTDPFSSSIFSERQREYATVIRGNGVYTPQMVVDGAAEFVGSDSQKALKAIREAARSPKTGVDLHCGGNPLSVRVRVDSVSTDADVLLAITENRLQSNVTRGENRGRLMGHDSVTRRIAAIGPAKKQRLFVAETKLSLEKGWKRENLSAVVFLQDRTSRRILGVEQITLSACSSN